MEESQIACRFVTKLPAKYRVPAADIAVPSNLTRYGLSQIVNHLLDLDEPVPFDFLINGQLVRLPMGRCLVAQNISAESVLTVEYIFAVMPPKLKEQMLHEDWVSAVDSVVPGRVFSGCYDGMLRVWDGAGKKLGEAQLHKGPISALQVFTRSAKPFMLTAGKLDHIVRLHQVPEEAAQLRNAPCPAIYRGHDGSVLDLAAAPDELHFVSASQDTSLRVWATGDNLPAGELQDQQSTTKKKRKSHSGQPVGSESIAVEQRIELKGHTDAATSVVWVEDESIYSGAMDHSVRRWNAETGTNIDTFHSKKAVYCVASPPADPNLVAFAGAAKTLQLWDPRQKHSETSPSSEQHLATASMDKNLKLWDTRSSIPLSTLEGHTEQVLCVSWWEDNKLVSGGADNTIRIFETGLQS